MNIPKIIILAAMVAALTHCDVFLHGVDDEVQNTGTDDDDDDSSGEGDKEECYSNAVEHEAANGDTICCPSGRPKFCEESNEGDWTGCWPNGYDCSTIILCDGTYGACEIGQSSHCSYIGQVFCCGNEYPVFCDMKPSGFPGACGAEGTDCSTATKCGDTWGICKTGYTPVCSDGVLYCEPPSY